MLEFLGISILEWLGYAASVIVLVSLSMASIVKLRWYNMLGAALFSLWLSNWCLPCWDNEFTDSRHQYLLFSEDEST